MLSNRLAFAALGVACVAAAGAGSFLATRQSAPSQQAALAASAAPVPTTETAVPVTETEGILGDAPSKEPAPAAAHNLPAESPDQLHKTAPIASTRTASQPQRPAASPRAEAAPNPVPAAPAPQQARVNAPLPPPAPLPPAASLPAPPPSAPPASNDGGFVSVTSREPEPAREPEVIRAPEPPAKQAQELVVSVGTVIGLQVESMVTSERAKVEDRVDARVSRDVRVGNDIVIPSGARAIGSVVSVERGGRVKDPARLGVRFHTLVLADGTRLPITTDTIYRVGAAPGDAAAAKMGGGAVAGAILGAIMGGAKGAAIGGAVGAGAGTTAVMTGERKAATLASGEVVNAKLLYPVPVTIDK